MTEHLPPSAESAAGLASPYDRTPLVSHWFGTCSCGHPLSKGEGA